jgi:hypothetical protein
MEREIAARHGLPSASSRDRGSSSVEPSLSRRDWSIGSTDVKFAVTDLFVVGTALDLVGGALIAKGLLVSTPVLALRAGTYWGGNPNVAVGAIEDRTDAQVGLLILGLGFILQAAGYIATLAAEPKVPASGSRAFTALGLVAVAVAVSALAWRFARLQMIRRALMKLARLDTNDMSPPRVRDLPDLKELAIYGRAWKGRQTALDGPREEMDRDDVRLIFGDIETCSETG